MKLNTTGVSNTLNTIVGLIQRLNPVVAALPEVAGLIEAAISVFNSSDKQAVQDAYAEKIAQTDAAHEETQKELGEVAAKADPKPAAAAPKA